MNNLKITLAALSFLFITACDSQFMKNADSAANAGDPFKVLEDAAAAADFTLDDYKGLPPEIEGCTCYFSENAAKFKTENYLFTSNANGLGIVSINNKQVKLKQLTVVHGKDTGGSDTSVYTGDIYTVTIVITSKKRSSDEVWTNEGTITVETKDGKKLVKQFTGDCGC